MIPIDFQVTWSKVKVKPLFSAHCVVRSIFFNPFTWSIPNLVQGLHPISCWSLFIFRSRVQRSRSNYSFEPSVLSTLYILIAWLLALYRFCFYREDRPEFCTMGGGGHRCFWNISCLSSSLEPLCQFQPNDTHNLIKWKIIVTLWKYSRTTGLYSTKLSREYPLVYDKGRAKMSSKGR